MGVRFELVGGRADCAGCHARTQGSHATGHVIAEPGRRHELLAHMPTLLHFDTPGMTSVHAALHAAYTDTGGAKRWRRELSSHSSALGAGPAC